MTNDTLESLEREIRRLADNRNQTVEEFCAKAKQTDMAAYRLAAHVPELIAEIRELTALKDHYREHMAAEAKGHLHAPGL